MSAGPLDRYAGFCVNWLFPLHERLKGQPSVAQLLRLRSFLHDIGQRVPYYRTLFARHGMVPQQLQDPAELQRLPCLDKPLVRQHAQALLAQGHGRLRRYSTGGSSGEPLQFWVSRARLAHDVAARRRAMRWWGVDVGAREAVVWGSPIELGAQDRLRRLRDGLLRSHLLPAFGVSAAVLDGQLRQLQRLRPAMLYGYPSSLALLAGHARQRGLSLERLGVRVVFVTGELLQPPQRALLQQVFACPVANGYGARDAGFVAHECPFGGMHLCSEDLLVEILDPQGRPVAPGVSGEIVVTHLCSADFPLLRYRTGDVGALAGQACACGRGLPLLGDLQGKSNQLLLAQDGSVLPAAALSYVLRELPLVAYQVHQRARDLVVIQVVAERLDAQCQRRIVQGLQARLGAGVRVQLQQVQAIAALPSGKHRYVLSDLDALAELGQGAGHA